MPLIRYYIDDLNNNSQFMVSRWDEKLSLEQNILEQDRQAKVLKKIEQLERQARTEKQPKKKFELVQSIKHLKEKFKMKNTDIFYIVRMNMILILQVSFSFFMLSIEMSLDTAIYMLLLSGVFFLGTTYPILNMIYKAMSYPIKFRIFTLTCCITSIITIYTLLYISIFNYDNNSFVGINIAKSSFDTYIDFLYFSTVTFTTLGYGDIYPASSLAKIACMLEVITFAVYISIVIGVLRNNQEGK